MTLYDELKYLEVNLYIREIKKLNVQIHELKEDIEKKIRKSLILKILKCPLKIVLMK